MTDTNRVILVGRVTRDVGSDERSFGYVGASGTARANVGLAVSRNRKDASGQWVEDTSFFDITVWGKTAENLKPYLTKGKQILIEGYLKQDRWEKDGQKYSKVNIIADNVQLLGGKNSGGGNSTGYSAPSPSSAPSSGYQGAGAANTGYSASSSDAPFPEDIPF